MGDAGDDRSTVRLRPSGQEDTLVGPERPTSSPATDLTRLVDVDPRFYAIRDEIARGGMGRIQVARDLRLGRDVALKELLTTSSELDARFEREARITARLQHPSIVSVYEAGRWPGGQPFYAMELVSGRSLHHVIAGAKTLAARLALIPSLLAVADAIAYAHSRQVIHRDLKPGNVIVGEFGETIVIDWGIAKYVDATDPPMPDSPLPTTDGQTQAGIVMGTPGYMSPEQATGDIVDERTDVYAIGAIAYHMLTGKLPGQNAALRLPPDVPPDLAAIVARATAARRDARYPNARELADDLRRFQTGQLVGAHRYSLRQLLRRWLRRHRAAVAVAAIAATVLLAVGGFALQRVFSARALATQRGADAEDAMEFMLFDLGAKLRKAGRLELMDGVTRRALAYYDARAVAGDTDPLQLATAFESVGDVLRDEGDLAASLAQYRRALVLADANPQTREWIHHSAVAHSSIGEALYLQGDLAGALSEQQRTISLVEGQTDARSLDVLSTAQNRAAAVLEDRGDGPGALAYLKAVLDIRTKLGAAQPAEPRARHALVNAHSDYGMALLHQSDRAGALAELHTALDIATKLVADDPRTPEWQRDVAIEHERLGDMMRMGSDSAGALAEYRQVVTIMKKLVDSEPANPDWQRRLSVGHERVGSMLLASGDIDGSLVELRACKQIRLALTTRDPTNARWQRDLSVATNRIGDALLARNDAAGALDAYRTAKEMRDRLVAKDPTNAKWQADEFESHRRIGNALARTDAAAAIAEYDAALAVVRALKDPGAVDAANLAEVQNAREALLNR